MWETERLAEADDYARQYDMSRLFDENTSIEAAIGTGQIIANTLVNMRRTAVRFITPILLSSGQPIG